MIAVATLPSRWFAKISGLLEKRAYSPFNILLFSLFVGAFRRFLEWAMGGVAEPFPISFAVTLTGFYWLSFFLIALLLRLLVKQPWRRSINVVLVGIFLGIFPPIIDTLANGTGFSYAYMWGVPTNFNWLLYNPELGIPIGETAVLWAVIVLTAAYVALRTRSVIRSAAALALAYGALLILGGLSSAAASLIAILLGWQPTHQIALVNLLQILLAAGIYLMLQPRLAAGLLRRSPYAAGYLSLAFLGAFLTGGISPTTFAYAPLILVFAAAALVENDAAAGHDYADADDVRFLRITTGLLLAALAAANSTVFLALTPLAAAALLARRHPIAGVIVRAASVYLAGAAASIEHVAYGAPRWWIAFLPEPAAPGLLGAYPAVSLAGLAAVAAGAAFVGVVRNTKPAVLTETPQPAGAAHIALLAFAASALRLLLEWALHGAYPAGLLAHTLLWTGQHLLAFFVFTLVLKAAVPRPWRLTAAAATPWLGLAVAAPILGALFGGQVVIDRVWAPPAAWSWLLHYPGHGIGAGETAAWWAAITAATVYSWQTKRRVLTPLAVALGTYLAAVTVVMAPSMAAEYLRLLAGWPQEFRFAVLNALQLVAVLAAYALLQTGLLRGGVRRAPHALPFMLICYLGSAFAGQVTLTTFIYALTIFLAGWIALCQNDYFDGLEEDAVQGRKAYLSLDDVRFLTAVAALGIGALAAAHSSVTLPALMAFATIVLYNFPFYRAKRYFPSNLKIEGVWGFCAFSFGILAAFESAAYGAPRWWATHSPLPPEALRGPFPETTLAAMFLALGGFSLVAALKDYKDWQADLQSGVQTLYTVAAKRRWPVDTTHAFVRGLCAAAVASAPVLLALAGKSGWGYTGAGAAAAAAVWVLMAPPPSARRFRATLLVLSAYFMLLVAALAAR